MDWLWPEADPKRARNSLNSAICALRKLLARIDNSSIASPDYLLFDRGQYWLSSDMRVRSDRDEFDERYRHACHLEKDRQVPEAIAEYNKALELYRGDFLAENLYEEWTLIERERLVNVYITMLERVAAYYMRNEQYQECIATCYRALEKDPCQEGSHRLLMECYTRLGARAIGLRQYEICKEILRLKYGTVPSPETKALYSSL